MSEYRKLINKFLECCEVDHFNEFILQKYSGLEDYNQATNLEHLIIELEKNEILSDKNIQCLKDLTMIINDCELTLYYEFYLADKKLPDDDEDSYDNEDCDYDRNFSTNLNGN